LAFNNCLDVTCIK